MMGGRSWDEWIEEYAAGHQHPVNRMTHTFGIPMIVLSILLVPVSFFVSGLWMIALALFVIGWILQFIGHYFEYQGRRSPKPSTHLSRGARRASTQ